MTEQDIIGSFLEVFEDVFINQQTTYKCTGKNNGTFRIAKTLFETTNCHWLLNLINFQRKESFNHNTLIRN